MLAAFSANHSGNRTFHVILDVQAPNVLGETPLLAAVRAQARPEVIRLLLEARADPNHQDFHVKRASSE
eukprot:s3178_g4.t1